MEWDESFDFVIIGSGGGAMCAAITAQEVGLRPLIIEKQDKVGGSTSLSGGVMWIPNNPLMKRFGVPDTEEDARTYLDACAGEPMPGSTPARRKAFLTEAPRMIDALEKAGMKFVIAEGWACYHHLEKPGGNPRGRCLVAQIYDVNDLGPAKGMLLRRAVKPPPILTHEMHLVSAGATNWPAIKTMASIGLRLIRDKLGADLVGMGTGLQARMLKILLDRGIPMWTNAVPQRFIVENGRVVGLEIKREKDTVTVEGRRGVLIAAGGFSRNEAMRQRHLPHPTSAKWAHGNLGDTGEMIEMAQGLGAATALLDHVIWSSTSVLPNGTAMMHTADVAHPHLILVDANGERFVNESTSYVTIGQTMYRRNHAIGAQFSWYILDGRYLARYRWGGIPPGKAPIEEWVKSGYMKRADSIEELAKQCGIDPRALKKTAERFNGFARSGMDEDFRRGHNNHNKFLGDPSVKPNPCLGAIDQGPFYAVQAVQGDVGTAGGLVADEFARVLREDGTPIAGLYAAGNATASPMGPSYPGAGASIGPAYTFGYIAAKHAASNAAAAPAQTRELAAA